MVNLEAIDTSVKSAQRIIMVVTAAFIVIAVGAGAMLRYLFNVDLYGAEEFITIAAFWLYFSGAVYATHTNSHISAEIVSTYVTSPKIRKFLHLFRGVVTTALALLYSVWAWEFFYWSLTEGGWTTVWQIPLVIAHTAVFVGFVLMAWYFLVDLIGDFSSVLKLKIRVASQYAKNHPTTAALYDFEKRVEEATSGHIRIGVHPENELGDYTQVYEELRLGTIGMALISVPSQVDSRLEIIYLHYAARSYSEARRIYGRHSPLFNHVKQLHADLGVQFLGFNVEGFGGLALKRLPDNLRQPDSPKGLAMRVPPIGIFKVTAEDQGFETASVPYLELPEALRTGTLDGSIGGPPAATYLQFREFFTHFVVNHNFFESTSFLMNKALWDSLSETDQKLIEDIVADLSEKSFEVAEANDREYLERMRDAGLKVITFSEQELEQWAAHTRKVTWPKLGTRLGEGVIARLTDEQSDLQTASDTEDKGSKHVDSGRQEP